MNHETEVRCELCGREFAAIGWSHLKWTHNTTLSEYRDMFPQAMLCSNEHRRKISESLNAYNVKNPMSEETKQKLSESLNAHYAGNGGKETRRKISESESAYYKENLVSEETKRKMSESQRTFWASEAGKEAGLKISEANTNNTYGLGYKHTKEARVKISEAQKDLWKGPEYAKMMIEALHLKPNVPERQLTSVLSKHFPNEWKYVGDGTFWLEGRNPDFMNVNGKKQIIEVFGYYWHDPFSFPNRPTEEELIAHYKKFGFDCLVLWEFDVWNEEDVLTRMREAFDKV